MSQGSTGPPALRCCSPPPLSACGAGGEWGRVVPFRLLGAPLTAWMEAGWGSRLTLGSFLELPRHPVRSLCQGWRQDSQQVGQKGAGDARAGAAHRAEASGQAPESPRLLLSPSGTPHPGRPRHWRWGPTIPPLNETWAVRQGRRRVAGVGGEGPDRVAKAHLESPAAVCSQAGPAPAPQSPFCGMGREPHPPYRCVGRFSYHRYKPPVTPDAQ